MIDDLKPLLSKFMVFAKDRLKFQKPPRLFLKQDSKNSECLLGRTAHYDPAQMSVTLYVSGRHPKDIMRSFAHELVHHCQNERGDLAPEKMKTMNKNYAQENEHMRKMEEEAYLQGNMCFRDWEDSLDNKLKYKMQVAEQNYLKENKKMSVKKEKLTKKLLKETIEKLLNKRIGAEEKGKINERRSGPSYRDMARLFGNSSLIPERYRPEVQEQIKKVVELYKDFHLSQGELLFALYNGRPQVRDAANAMDFEEGMRMVYELSKLIVKKEARKDATFNQKFYAYKTGKNVDDAASELAGMGFDDTIIPQLKKGVEDMKSDFNSDDMKKGFSGAYAGEEEEPDFKKLRSAPKTVPEGKIKTPEDENALYESRFEERNTNLFEKLLKEWTK